MFFLFNSLIIWGRGVCVCVWVWVEGERGIVIVSVGSTTVFYWYNIKIVYILVYCKNNKLIFWRGRQR